jgi:hypothetical protein
MRSKYKPTPCPGDHPSREAIEKAMRDDPNWQADREFVAVAAPVARKAREALVTRPRHRPVLRVARPRETHVQGPSRRRSGATSATSSSDPGDNDPDPDGRARFHVGRRA